MKKGKQKTQSKKGKCPFCGRQATTNVYLDKQSGVIAVPIPFEIDICGSEECNQALDNVIFKREFIFKENRV